MSKEKLLAESYEPEFVALWEDDPSGLTRIREYIQGADDVAGWVNLSTVVADFEFSSGIYPQEG